MSAIRIRIVLAATVATAALGGFLGQRIHRVHDVERVYTSQGFGGLVPKPVPTPRTTDDALAPAIEAMEQGRYWQAETEAARVASRHPAGENGRRTLARARLVQGFASARQRNLAAARSRFAEARTAAACLPPPPVISKGAARREIDLEAEAAYQHAVCTAALGRRADAQAEYVAFMRRYPLSPRSNAAVRRIAAMHGGDLPPDVERVRVAVAARAESVRKAAQRDQSLCAPACLAELLRRNGRQADVDALAAEMGTTHEGTTLAALAAAADRRGLKNKGLLLTQAGLRKQALPVITLLAPSHFVIVDRTDAQGVTVWDPDGAGSGRAAVRRFTTTEWTRAWRGASLAVGQVM